MERYAQMKNSGVGWIQDIPTGWGVRVLFQLADQVKNKNKDLAEKNLLSLSYGKIKRKTRLPERHSKQPNLWLRLPQTPQREIAPKPNF